VKDRLSVGKGRSAYSQRKVNPLIFGAKWPLTCAGWNQVLGTQLLELVVEQSAQISYRILLLFEMTLGTKR
jgi:hypothetical protein